MAEGTTAGVSPFSEADFERALNEEKGSTPAEGWARLKETENAEIWRKVVPGVAVQGYYKDNCNVHNMTLEYRTDFLYPSVSASVKRRL